MEPVTGQIGPCNIPYYYLKTFMMKVLRLFYVVLTLNIMLTVSRLKYKRSTQFIILLHRHNHMKRLTQLRFKFRLMIGYFLPVHTFCIYNF